jgi:hypothetical protein
MKKMFVMLVCFGSLLFGAGAADGAKDFEEWTEKEIKHFKKS